VLGGEEVPPGDLDLFRFVALGAAPGRKKKSNRL